MKVTVSDSAAGRVEQGIAPPMRMAVTLPVLIDGRLSSVVLYVCTSAFGPAGERGLTADQLAEVARLIAATLNGPAPSVENFQ